ncbi:MAG TPA: bifunctional 5,10-methylenetetrahydrofolate dehydrogenase/5,10-methenyltetrahydrofolate cyclohydrolase [Fimbriimonadaceae bacterium]|nr:bifunctional 5,10-methylene-tetrahydrofolate dehydrogenase/5,10-methylene-tetrahydrofolate cyclohydrolase [Armatimonadota bacterium]HRD31882.1 bifunctional 5,10-methylenetetrahydrofolate dehydrogenase/5,10-methenyltetrahydrofolate cyclohydrolase [Fimbriimonadaceae bacterium]HRE94998.1 bifunctional 5,10-methylenetetrahydrofolate dehydrogenase/5,10-methenyltetrahydrofolate cyclohydrolase [Fimbriimonadaceae bacterium]HRI73368.1 bifunctional 5,10-methylenetetrahydrofolate dehydrogenase/5,10-methe
MSAQILDGRALSTQFRAELQTRVAALRAQGIVPRLEAIVAAQDPASLAYVRMKRSWAEKAGMESGSWEANEHTTQAELLDQIARLNADPKVHGVLLQHPLPKHLDEDAALLALGPDKDADGITPASLGRLTAGLPGFRCATPLGIMRLLQHHQIELAGRRAIVIGRSVILGKPMALMLLEANATVTIAHSRTQNLADLVREHDIVVAAVGRAEMVKGDWLKPEAVVVDAGYNKVEGRTHDVGDCEYDSCAEVASWITPVPGGVGPMTVVSLLMNTVDAAEAQRKS